MKDISPVFGSLGSNYTFKFACQTLWCYCFPPNKSKTQLVLAEQLNRPFPAFSQGYFFATGRDAIQFALQNAAITRGAKVLTQAFSCAAIEEAIDGAGLQPVMLIRDAVNLSLETIQGHDAHLMQGGLSSAFVGCPADVTETSQTHITLDRRFGPGFGGVTQSVNR